MSGLCAVYPEIKLEGKVIAFTGISDRATRKEIGGLIALNQGVVTDEVSEADYLVVGSGGNPAWAFGCYRRKVELAVNLRKAGHRIVIVNEADFWDAIDPAGSVHIPGLPLFESALCMVIALVFAVRGFARNDPIGAIPVVKQTVQTRGLARECYGSAPCRGDLTRAIPNALGVYAEV